MSKPQDQMLRGVRVLEDLMSDAGFAFRVKTSGDASGGSYAVGEYIKQHGEESRQIELHHRRRLGLVYYRVGSLKLSHRQYMEGLGVQRDSAFMWTTDDADGYAELKSDLESYCEDFLTGTCEEWMPIAQELQRAGKERQAQAQAAAAGDGRLRSQAERHFRAGQYREAVLLWKQVKFPDLMAASEKAMFKIARKRM